jgi:hypothetical protein
VTGLVGAVAEALKGGTVDALARLGGQSDEITYVSYPITGIEKTEDGNLLVSGKATDDTEDSDRQIVDHAFSSKGLPKWFETGANIRVQHSPILYPAGVGVKLETRPDGQWLTAKVVEPTAKMLVLEKVLTCFSVGIARPRVVRDNVAKGGRIVDGEFCEVSLVDRGSNYNSRFQMVGKAADGSAVPMALLEAPDDVLAAVKTAEAPDAAKAGHDPFTGTHSHAHPAFGDQGDDANHEHEHTHADDANHDHPHPDTSKAADMKTCPTCDGDGKIMDDKRQCPDCGGDGKVPANFEKAAEKATLSVADQNDLPDSDFAYIEPGGTKDASGKTTPRDLRHFCIVDAAHTRNALARASGGQSPFADKAMPKILAAAKKFGIKVSDNGKVSVPYTVKRLHDMLCCAYDWDAVVDAYPTVEKDGAALALSPTAKGIVYQLLLGEVTEDAGSGTESGDIANIAKAYDHLCQFIMSETVEALMGDPDDQAILADARAHMVKLFKAANEPGVAGGGTGWPTPGNVMAGQFNRPYIAAGHQREDGTSGSPANIPASSPLSPDQFQRGPLTAGVERPSPGTVKGRDFYSHASRDSYASVMSTVHDALASAMPGVCPMAPTPAVVPTATNAPAPQTTSTATAGTPTVDMRAGSGPTVVPSPGVTPGVAKAASDLGPSADEIQALVDAAVTKAAEPLLTKIAGLEQQIVDWESEPDPREDPHRGGVTTSRVTLAKAATDGAEAQEVAEKAARDAEDADYLRMLRAAAQSGNTEMRLRAQAVLDEKIRAGLIPA